ncbi:hypothetical protein NLJ89_g3790 [Agrocybe chaxingu]|uniref:Uncharacterized protein n=1 Tax=Agrocybe chaxingu TaxID=84603 RepID=A0A9W8MV61_9AGAR|nr:hypothetical protein NLJ89_g3790 [Agrocybe chaxingu]
MNNYISYRLPSGRHSSGHPPVSAGDYFPGTHPAGASDIGPMRSRRLRDPWSFVLSPRSPRDTTRYHGSAYTEPLSPSLIPSAPLMMNNKPLPETSLESLEFYPEPQPPTPELAICVSDPMDPQDMDLIRAEVAHFIQTKTKRANNTLTFTWTKGNNLRGRIIFQKLFEKLNRTLRVDRRKIRLLEAFERMTFTMPEKVKDLELWDVSFDDDTPTTDLIDFANATNLREFTWMGDFSLLASKCIRIPFRNLHTLKIFGSFMSVEDAVSILYSSPNLVCAGLGDIDDTASSRRRNGIIQTSKQTEVQFRRLQHLTISTKEPIDRILGGICWKTLDSLTLALDARGIVGVPRAIPRLPHLARVHCLTLILEGRLPVGDAERIRMLMKNVTVKLIRK